MDEESGNPFSAHSEDARLAFEQSPLAQAFAGLDGRLTCVNRSLAALLGHSPGWFRGRHVTALLHPLDDPQLRGELRRLQQGQTDAISVEVVAGHLDGRARQLLVDASLIRQHDGTPRSVALVAHDLTSARSAEERLARQERLYRALSNRATDPAVITDSDLIVTFVSPTFTDVLGHDQTVLLATHFTDLVHENDRAEVEHIAQIASRQAHRAERCVARMSALTAGWRWTEITIVNSLADPDVGGLIVNLRDVTAQLESARALRDSEARYRAIVETAQEGILTVDALGKVGLANDRIAEILGLSMAEVRRSYGISRLLESAVQPGVDSGIVRRQVRYRHPDGRHRTLSVSSSPLPGQVVAETLVMVSDVTESHRLQKRLRHQALHDQLTGLPNRYLFKDRLNTAAARQQRGSEDPTAVLHLDLDQFKQINDLYGHTVGDLVLQRIGTRITQVLRSSDTVARLGGDEFAIICEGADATTAQMIARRMQDEVFGDVDVDGRTVVVTASIGIATFPPHVPEGVLALADTAMYEAKRQGAGGIAVYGQD